MPAPPTVATAARAVYRRLCFEGALFGLFARSRCGPRFGAARKGCEAVRFSASTSAPTLAVPTKLAGVAAFQGAVAALRGLAPPFGLRLDAVREDGPDGEPRLAVHVRAAGPAATLSGARLGFVQAKHLLWLLDLLPLGVEVRLTAVTGDPERGRLLGVNVHLHGVGAALVRLLQAEADGYEAARSAART